MSPVTSGSDHNPPSFSSTSPLSVTGSSSNTTASQNQHAIPSSLLIVGSGVFGLSTALALTERPEFSQTTITVVDRSPEAGVFPSRDASSIDSSRIIRADYADPAYAALAAAAQEKWRQQSHPDDLGAQGRYTETGFLVVADKPSSTTSSTAPGRQEASAKKKSGYDYVRSSYDNVLALTRGSPALASKIQELPDRAAIRDAYGSGGTYGTWGYINKLSGWANAEASMDWLYRRVQATGRVKFVNGTVTSLLYTSSALSSSRVAGVSLANGTALTADLTVLATGAWTPTLLDMSGRAIATGQVLAYMDLTDDEQARLAHKPTFISLSTGYFIITPSNNILKIARHAYGYLNPTASPIVAGATISTPVTHLTQPDLAVPQVEQDAMRAALAEMIPWPELVKRPFKSTKMCWYTDTPDGDFIIDYHPDHDGLFLATGGSGHGFKFLPVIGDRITDCILGRVPEEFQGKWSLKKNITTTAGSNEWDQVITEDGSRGGEPGLRLCGDSTTNVRSKQSRL
ncbi:FAD dependent oxidoreductase-domain-containing protein [Coniella lustricola]|uniref:FAD dependent oxidoreductase-domain-containing protein n=1 Tax=Coniella lustricola TaxID=2025994 RepID=A0A2T2ZXD4_9PEZI|nr:FAD dependent oxidoreductase-domain-containing protein [Coniella lustricola]